MASKTNGYFYQNARFTLLFHLFTHRHWDEFYQQSDIDALAAAGISHVRIPYGYWMVDVRPGVASRAQLFIFILLVKRIYFKGKYGIMKSELAYFRPPS